MSPDENPAGPTAPTREEMQEFIDSLPLAKHRAGELGLYRAMHALDDAVRIAGWEFADILEKQT